MLQELRQVDALIEEGDLVGAQRLCKQLLQKQPTNAAAHEKMGDVMRKRELWEDAAEWYDLAGQLQDTEALRAKRADVLQRAKEARKSGPEPHLVDEDTPSRLMLWLGLGAAAMLLVVVGVVFSIFSRGTPPEQAEGRRVADGDGPVAGGSSLSAPSPVRGTRSVPASGAGAGTGIQTIPHATANPDRHWTATRMPRRAPRRALSTRSTTGISASSPEPTTDHDQAVINAVSSLTWGDSRPMTGRVSAMVEPFSSYAMVSVTIPQALPEDGIVEAVVRQAWRVAVAAVQSDEVIKSLTIRMVRVNADGERVVAFRGNTSRAMLQAVDTDRPDFRTLWTKVFADVWWNPEAGGNAPVVGQGANSGA